ncbi:DUF2703 domain-containing protein [Candidatus Microgenomates bacterium]|nr:DUF2703 domain-containing protein [Candidatus Microgenomates bacterium]
MKKLLIEWRHFDKEGNTCRRCSNTGTSLHKAIDELKEELDTKGINISFKETKLSENEIKESNSILFNGILIEDLLNETKSVETPCNSCCELVGSPVNCRALDCSGQISEDISVELIKKAAKNFISRKETQ